MRSLCATYRLAAGGPAPIAILDVMAASGDALDGALVALGIGAVPVGGVRLRDLLGVDRGVVARPSSTLVQLMPHGGVRIVALLAAALAARGLREEARPDASLAYPEACDEVEALALEALAHAASPLAAKLLLDQSRRWREPRAGGGPRDANRDAAREFILSRLLRPALVVGVGATNIGKSTLLNAMAGASVAIVADEPGTTRDHVGVLLDAGGLVVRYIDTPGLRGRGDSQGVTDVERAAIAASLEVAKRADLILLMTDSVAAAVVPPGLEGIPTLVVGLRGDLGPPQTAAEVVVSGLHVEGTEGARVVLDAIRRRLVPDEALRDQRPWRFW